MIDLEETAVLTWLTNFIQETEDLAATLFSTKYLLVGKDKTDYYEERLRSAKSLLALLNKDKQILSEVASSIKASESDEFKRRANFRLGLINNHLTRIDALMPCIMHLTTDDGVYVDVTEVFVL